MGAHGGHSTADRPVHRLLLQTPRPAPPHPSESTRLRATATAPIERTGRLSGASPRLFTKTPTPPAPLFSPEPEPTPSPIQTVAAVAERVVTPPAPAAACDHPSPQSSRLRRPHLRPSRPLSLAEARELSCLGWVVVHPAVAAAVTKRGISAPDAAIPADRSDVRIGRSMGVTQPGSSGDCWRTRAGSGSCGHDDVRRAGVYQAVEEGVRGDDSGAAASVREVAIAPCRVGVSVPRGVLFGCGDLIFSSHMIFTLVFVRTYYKYGSNRLIKLLSWLMAIIQSLLIIASRKHYTVDVVVAWYTVNLVVFFVDKKLPEMPDRSNGLSLLPVSTKDKDGRMKEELHKLEKDGRMMDEFHKLLNGNTVDATDWVLLITSQFLNYLKWFGRQRVQMNGKHQGRICHRGWGGSSPPYRGRAHGPVFRNFRQGKRNFYHGAREGGAGGAARG
uniref:Sphingomyelin synthase-like domain-containing protein n=1 Tax=Saccharum spontaneum TaxID=62335 RepID=A0A678TQC3_SACSP|nr:hypothetical protein SS34H08_000002 [Saccharum spontaneum]